MVGYTPSSRRTAERYGGMLWPFFADFGKAPDRVAPADVLASAHGIRQVRPNLLGHDGRPDRHKGPVSELSAGPGLWNAQCVTISPSLLTSSAV